MADDDRFRSYSPNDPHRRAVERPSDQASDPLAELARLIGQNDPFVEFGRTSQHQPQQRRLAVPPERADRQYDLAEEHFAADRSRDSASGQYARNEDYPYPLAHEPRVDDRHLDSRRYDETRLDVEYHDRQYADDRVPDRRQDEGQEQSEAQELTSYYHDDVPLAPHEDEMYDDAPRKRRFAGLTTALALIGCAMLGTAGAYTYRSYGHPSAAQTPPVITADGSTPTKIVPATAGDPQSSKPVQDRVANVSSEQVVSKQEEPVALKELGTQATPRVVLPAPVAPVQAAPPLPSAGPAPGASAPGGSGEPKRVRTVTIRPDGSDVSGRPVAVPPPAGRTPDAAATTRSVTPPAARATPPATAPARGGSVPLSLDPQSSEPAAAAPARARSAALPPAPDSTTASTSGAIVVQLSSQKTEAEAQSSFRSLQAKFPNELADRKPIIRRVDLGTKGVVYRAMVGPFASAREATQFCSSYKAAGGQCLVPTN